MRTGSFGLGRIASILLIGAMIGTVAPATPVAALSPTACRVTNERTGIVRTALAPAVTAAKRGDTLTIRGTCAAGLSIAKRIELRGVRPSGAGTPTLLGGAGGSVLTIAEQGNVRLRGLTITGGNGTLITDQRNGGGLYVDGRVVLTGVHVTNNAVDGSGGGIYSFGGTVIIGGDSVIDANAAATGGGIAVGFGTLRIAGSARVADNSATSDGGGILAGFAALTIEGNAVVTGNQASARGGGVLIAAGTAAIGGKARITTNTAGAALGAGGGIAVTNEGSLTIREQAVVGGNTASAGSGGGVSVSGTLALTGEARISGNHAAERGGGVWLDTATNGSSLLMTGSSRIRENVAETGSGGGLTRVNGTTYVAADCGTRIVSNVPGNCETVLVSLGS